MKYTDKFNLAISPVAAESLVTAPDLLEVKQEIEELLKMAKYTIKHDSENGYIEYDKNPEILIVGNMGNTRVIRDRSPWRLPLEVSDEISNIPITFAVYSTAPIQGEIEAYLVILYREAPAQPVCPTCGKKHLFVISKG